MNDFTRKLLVLTAPVGCQEQGIEAADLYKNRCWELVRDIQQLDPTDKFIKWPRKDFLMIEMSCYRTDPDLLTRDLRLFRQAVQRLKTICSSLHQLDSVFWLKIEASLYLVYIHRLSALFLSEQWQKDSFWLFTETIYFLQHAHLRLFYHSLKGRISDDEWVIYRSSLRVRTMQCMAELISFYDRLVRGQISQKTPEITIRRAVIKDFQRSIQMRCEFDKDEASAFSEYIRMEKEAFEECYRYGLLLARDLKVSYCHLTRAGLAIHHFRDRMLALHQRAIISVV